MAAWLQRSHRLAATEAPFHTVNRYMRLWVNAITLGIESSEQHSTENAHKQWQQVRASAFLFCVVRLNANGVHGTEFETNSICFAQIGSATRINIAQLSSLDQSIHNSVDNIEMP